MEQARPFNASALPEHNTSMYTPLTGGSQELNAVPVSLPTPNVMQYNCYAGTLGAAGVPAQSVQLEPTNDSVVSEQLWQENK